MDSENEMRRKSDPESAALLPIMILMFFPLLIGIILAGYADWAGMKELKEIEDTPRLLLYLGGMVVLMAISLWTIFYVTFAIIRNTRGMKEALPLLWRDDYGDDIPEEPEDESETPAVTKERRSKRKANRRKLRKAGYVATLALLALLGMASGAALSESQRMLHDYFGYDALVEAGDLMQYAVDALAIGILLIMLAVVLWLYHTMLHDMGYYRMLVRSFPELPEDDPYYDDDDEEDDSKEDERR